MKLRVHALGAVRSKIDEFKLFIVNAAGGQVTVQIGKAWQGKNGVEPTMTRA